MSSHSNFETLPWYVQEYFNKSNISLESKVAYSKEIVEFFNWINSRKGFAHVIKNTSLSQLDDLSVDDIEHYKRYLLIKKPNLTSKKNGLSQASVARKLSPISSLFKYLAHEAEFESGDSYLKRNIFQKVRINGPKKTDFKAAEEIKQSILSYPQELQAFRNFVSNGYGLINTGRKLTWYNKNKERDTAIISLIMDCGLSMSDLEALTLDKIDLKNDQLKINEKQIAFLTSRSKTELKEYLKIRKEKYNVKDEIPNVFLTSYYNRAKPIYRRSIQEMIKKYAVAFGDSSLNAQQLRHSFAIQSYSKTKKFDFIQQLGITSINPMWVYAANNNNNTNRH